MAQMHPSRLPQVVRDDPQRAAERLLYDTLSRKLGDNYTVFYGVAWVMPGKHGQRARQGEIDFIVAHKNKGICVIECKGGAIGHDPQRGWYSTDRRDTRHNIQDPAEQANRNKHALRDKLRSLPGCKGEPPFMGHAVAFPQSADPGHDLKSDVPRKTTIFSDDLKSLEEKVETVLKFWQGNRTDTKDDISSALRLMEQHLAPCFELKRTLGVAVREDEQEILRLTEQQFGLLDFLSRQRRVAVSGGAGTGKSLLALEKARRLAAEGHRTLLTCFNRLLADDLRGVVDGAENLTVNTFHGLCEEMALAAGVPLPQVSPDKAPAEYFNKQLPEALVLALDKRPESRFDAIVVDEGQDFASEWWTLLELASANPGESILYVFYDEAQNLYGEKIALPDDLQPFQLTTNLRNTRTIHDLAARFYKGTLDPGGPEGRPVEFVALPEGRPLHRELSALLHRLVNKDGLRPGDIAILMGCSRRKSILADVDRLGAFEIIRDAATHTDRIVIESIHRFKGMERRVVILTELESLFENDRVPQDRRDSLLYVGLTRATGHVVVVGNAATVDWLKNARKG